MASMSEWIAVILLGIVEGITEFLPVSSTGHLLLTEILFQDWLPEFSDTFIIVIQSGAALAVLPLFPQRLVQVYHCWQDPTARDYVFKLAVAFLITCLGGYLLEKSDFTLPDTIPPVAISLLIGGVLFLVVERIVKSYPASVDVTWTIAIMVGLGQLVAAVFPGASRSGTTIILALLLGLNRSSATEFSFLVGVPTILAASGYKILQALGEQPDQAIEENWSMTLLGFAVSALVSFIVVKWLLGYVRTHTFHVFGWYRIVIGIVLLAALVA